MEMFRVPKQEKTVRILLDDGRILDGEIYTAMIGPDGQPGRVVDRLNDSSEEFLPVKSGEDRFLLNKSGIVTVQMEDGRDEIPTVEGSGREVTVRLSLAGGTGLLGQLLIVMPPERSRVIDFLNGAPRFFPLAGEGLVTLVQKRYVVSVRDLATE